LHTVPRTGCREGCVPHHSSAVFGLFGRPRLEEVGVQAGRWRGASEIKKWRNGLYEEVSWVAAYHLPRGGLAGLEICKCWRGTQQFVDFGLTSKAMRHCFCGKAGFLHDLELCSFVLVICPFSSSCLEVGTAARLQLAHYVCCRT